MEFINFKNKNNVISNKKKKIKINIVLVVNNLAGKYILLNHIIHS